MAVNYRAMRLQLTLLLGTCLIAQGAPGQQPNIVLIYFDDAGYNEFGFAADLFNQPTLFETPNIDALAQQSTVFSNGYVTGPVCSPSRAGLLTGIYQSRFGHERNISTGLSGEQDGLSGEQPIMPSYLSDLGYTSGAIGKWHLGYRPGVNRPLDLGFDEFFGFFGGDRRYFPYGNSGRADVAMRRGNTGIETVWGTEGDTTRYDPAQGRYVTDAFGEEAVDFITRHSQDSSPFFLYLAFNTPHAPSQAKQSDLDHFSHVEDPARRTTAAMMYAADRAVGDVMNALQAAGIDENTIVVLANDNGGTATTRNAPFYGSKGQLWEGGIRVPFLMRAPGIEAGVYDRPVATFDLLPTFLSFAGGDPSGLEEIDGVDLAPFLLGERTGDPHGVLHWRSVDGRFAVRSGDWKLTRPDPLINAPRLHHIPTDPRERTNVASQHPELVKELLRELTYWEAKLAKPRWGQLGNPTTVNLFDHFVFRHDVSPSPLWSNSSQWQQGGTSQLATLLPEDAYANAILEFRTSNSSDYTATNDMWRWTRETFMLNEIRLTGEHTGDENRQGTIDGNALLFVSSLNGLEPRLSLDAIAAGTAGSFTFQIDNELQLLDDLQITGNGTQNFDIRGRIVDYYEPRRVTKTGTSRVSLSGNNSYSGDTIVHEGTLSIGSPFFADGADILLYSDAVLDLNFVGTDTVSALLIDGIAQAIGLWGAIGNPVVDFHTSLIIGTGVLQVTAMSAGSPGDFNNDGVVDAADYVVWRKNVGTLYNQGHYTEWRTNYGVVYRSSLSASNVSTSNALAPEPGSAVTLLIGLAMIKLSWLARKSRG